MRKGLFHLLARDSALSKKDIFLVAAKLMGIDARWEESRHRRDKRGRFTSSGGGSGSTEKQAAKPRENASGQGRSPARKRPGKLPVDSDGVAYSRPTAAIHPKERSKIRHEVNGVYHANYQGKKVFVHRSHGLDGKAYQYKMESHGFDEYNIYERKEIE